MKNIHILPTQNNNSKLASCIYVGQNSIIKFGEIWLQLKNKGWTNCWSPRELYITSDEEIKEGDLVTDGKLMGYYSFDEDGCPIIKSSKDDRVYGFGLAPHSKKIILTTDTDLIEDRVQAIDDEFLEWFVKNPSCDKVGLEKLEGRYVDYSGNVHSPIIYKIIIPKEGTKQDYLEEAAKRWIRQPKLITNKESFIAGAKCYKEISYSEEEVRELLETQRGNCYVALLHHTKNDDIASVALNAPEPGGKNGTWVKKN